MTAVIPELIPLPGFLEAEICGPSYCRTISSVLASSCNLRSQKMLTWQGRYVTGRHRDGDISCTVWNPQQTAPPISSSSTLCECDRLGWGRILWWALNGVSQKNTGAAMYKNSASKIQQVPNVGQWWVWGKSYRPSFLKHWVDCLVPAQ